MENNNQIIRVYRNVPASLSLRFADYRNMATERWFAIESHQEFMPVALNYVISMFMIPGTMKSYQQGMFKFNDPIGAYITKSLNLAKDIVLPTTL